MASGMTSQPQGKSAADVQQRKSMQMLLLGAGGMMGFFLLGLWAMYLFNWGNSAPEKHDVATPANGPRAAPAVGPASPGTVAEAPALAETPPDTGPAVAPVRPAAAVAVNAGVLHGGVGLGTWDTTAEFKDMLVEGGDQKPLFKPELMGGTKDWRITGGSWDSAGGVLSQNLRTINCKITAGFPEWQDYTYSLKARRVDGTEGFLVIFAEEKENTLYWWNIGGWGNTRSAVEKLTNGGKREIPGSAVPLKIETNRWYSIKIELHGNTVHLSMDGTLVTTMEGATAHSTMPDAGPPTVFNNGDGPTSRQAIVPARPANTPAPARGVAANPVAPARPAGPLVPGPSRMPPPAGAPMQGDFGQPQLQQPQNRQRG